MLHFEFEPYIPHNQDSQTLRPTVRHQTQSVEKGKSLISREPDLDTATLGFGTIERIIRTYRIVRA